jgi:hypothetical protein
MLQQIKYLLLPGTTTTDTSVLRSETLWSSVLPAVPFTISRLVAAAFAVALRSASGSWPSRTDDLFVGGWDNFTWKV